MAWGVFHAKGSYTGSMLYLTETAAAAGDTNVYTTTTQTNTVFTVGDWPGINQNTTDYISYCWHDVPGLQKFGSYEGTELSDPAGAFIYCDFRPAWIMVKNIDAVEEWWMWDNKRDGFNPTYQYLEANDTDAENTTTNDCVIDIVSNGFKIRSQYAPNNANTYIYAAWAYQPMNNLYGGQSNAR